MKPEVASERESLRRQFASLVGNPFDHFFCPILFVDEDTELCQAHVVNRAFGTASSAWTIQRKDVDNFFGSMFEAKFVDLRFRQKDIAIKAFFDPDLYRRFRPRVLLDGNEIPHFIAKGTTPSRFARLTIEHEGANVDLALKLSTNIQVNGSSNWQFEVNQDFRIPAIVSVLKAAHLTAFTLLDYTYALGAGGAWLGHQLGSFYVKNRGLTRDEVHRNAVVHFRQCARMVRPVSNAPPAITGTVDDNWVHFCWSDDVNDRIPWGLVFYVKTEEDLHATLVPAFEHEAGAARFAHFLESDGDTFDTSIARFHNSHWTVDKTRRRIEWPAADLD